MEKKNHHRRMGQPERAFWRDVFVAVIKKGRYPNVRRAADVADDSVDEYRARITWRQS